MPLPSSAEAVGTELTVSSDLSMVLHGNHNTGKSALLADAATHYGADKSFIVVVREDPRATYSTFAPDVPVVYIEKYRDLEKLYKGINPGEFAFHGVDALSGVATLAAFDLFGQGVMPTEPDQWVLFHKKMDQFYEFWRAASTISLAVANSKRGGDAVTKQKALIGADMPGRQMMACTGNSGFTGYLEAAVNGKSEVERTVMFSPNKEIITRVNGLKTMIKDKIQLQEGPGNWSRIIETIISHRQ